MTAYVSPVEPYAHQRKALEKMKGQPGFALLMAMRTGKTKTLLDDFGRLELAGEVQDLFVLAPGGVYRTWEAAAYEHLSVDLRRRIQVHVWQSGAGRLAVAQREAFLADHSGPRVFLMNIEALSSVADARLAAVRFLARRKAMIAIDESTTIKNHASKRTKFVIGTLAPMAAYRRILSGLPTPNSPLDLYSQFEFLGPLILGFGSYYGFKATYAVTRRIQTGGRMIDVVVGYRGVEGLQRKIEPYSVRVRLEDCYDLPPKVFMIREVSMTTEQRRLYTEMRDFASAAIAEGAHVSATVVVAQIVRLHQILCGHAVSEDGHVHPVEENRTRELLDLFAETEDDAKAVVWCGYDYNVRAVADALEGEYGKGSVARFWGGNRDTREAEEIRFKTDAACRFMVATPAAGGRGRDWAVADLVVYYSNTADLEHRSQSEERPQAIGKTRPVAYIDLMVPGTIDEKIVNILRRKITLASAITGDAYREWLI